MIGVVNKFFIASICMWAAPVAILYGFNHNLFPVWDEWSLAISQQDKSFYNILGIIVVPLRKGFLKRMNAGCGTGFSQLSPESLTLWSGILAVISVNVVIAFYIYFAMKEPSDKHEPDPKFLADAKASIKQPGPSEADLSSDRAKQE